MCRLLGVISSEHTDFRLSLREAPRSLASLSREHPHGWGIAVFTDGAGWELQKAAACAHEDDRFHEVAAGSRGTLLIAHVRKGTVGPVTLENTHPFRSGRWVFAHNGTIDDFAHLQSRISPARRDEVGGETDSELLFAFLLTRLDEANAAGAPADQATDAALVAAVRALHEHPTLGASNFFLSDGEALYVHRAGRTLFLLERAPGDAVRVRRRSDETGAVIETPWSARRRAILIASEHITDEPWQEIPEPALLRIDRSPLPSWRRLA
ncbi:MAG: class II glutamine amidotransferase [Myxococcales bacterium]|nr:class II glutamine amidotransferase [Myxococcales bacterium]